MHHRYNSYFKSIWWKYQPSNIISNWNIPTDALCHLMPQFLKLISTLKGVSQFFRVPYLFQCSFFSVHHHLAGPRNFINFFSSAVRTANKGTRNTYVHRRCFFQGKVNWKSYPRVPTRSLFFHCIGIWNTARLITKCQFEQHYIVLCHPVKNHLFLVLTIAHFKTRKSQLKIISESPHSISILPLYRDLKQQARLITVFFKM